MKQLTNRNYEKLPEIRKKKEEERKREELAEKRKKQQEYQKALNERVR